MHEFTIFTTELNLKRPWYIEEVTLKESEYGEDLHIKIGHEKGAKFDYEGIEYAVYDHQERTWKQLDFFQHHSNDYRHHCLEQYPPC